MALNEWWKKAVVYQVYPRSFCDLNGDGVGDLRGILSKLDYFVWLGVDVLWLNPVFCSPMEDNGYDISDYYHVAEEFGTDEDLRALIGEAARRGIKILLDLVVNHCSSEHAWFQKALAKPECEEAGYFYFVSTQDGKRPNNWGSNFSGSVWEPVGDGRFYLHTFSPGQPDLNWENPKLREEIYKMINWWLDQGIAGFRVDAITFIKKDTTFQDRFPVNEQGFYPIEKLENCRGIGKFLGEMRDQCFAPRGAMTIAEAPGVPYEEFADYAGANGYFSMILDFSYPDMSRYLPGWSEEEFCARVRRSQLQAQERCWTAVFLESHDQPRSGDKYIPPDALDRYGDRPKKMLATLYFLLRGTPIIYQGQEIGMENAPFSSISDFRDASGIGRYTRAVEAGADPETELVFLRRSSRDNARTPMQWDESENAGFTRPDATPWIMTHPDSRARNVRAQRREGSLLEYYRSLTALRKDPVYGPVFVDGTFEEVVDAGRDALVYRRRLEDRQCLVACNFSGEEHGARLPHASWKVLLNNTRDVLMREGTLFLQPWQAVVLAEEK